jgi:hypothetical protein
VGATGRACSRPQPIPVDRLVAYVHDREGGNWLGFSLLRPAYKHWLIKDRLLRVEAQTIERNGMGVPLYKAAEGELDLSAGSNMAKSWRAGESAGSAIPNGADMVLRGVEGTLPDAKPSIRYHDEQIARAVLAHFLNLGTQTGSWALGTTFADFFTLSLQTLAQQIADTATSTSSRTWSTSTSAGRAGPAGGVRRDRLPAGRDRAALKSLADAGLINPDDVLQQAVRQQFGLPAIDPATAAAAAAQPVIPGDRPERRPRMPDLTGVELARPGTWDLARGKQTFTDQMLRDAADFYAASGGQRIPLGFGHRDSRFDGEPGVRVAVQRPLRRGRAPARCCSATWSSSTTGSRRPPRTAGRTAPSRASWA